MSVNLAKKDILKQEPMTRNRDHSKIVSMEEMARRRRSKKPGSRPPQKPGPPPEELSRLLIQIGSKEGPPEPVSAANIPFNSDGLKLFLELAGRDPNGSFRTDDGGLVRYRAVAWVADPDEPEVRLKLELSATGPGPLPEIRIALQLRGRCEGPEEIVTLWNLPDDALGRKIYEDMRRAFPNSDVQTSDYGYVPLRSTIRL